MRVPSPVTGTPEVVVVVKRKFPRFALALVANADKPKLVVSPFWSKGQAAMISRGNARLHTKVWAFALSAAQNRKAAEMYVNSFYMVFLLFIVDDAL